MRASNPILTTETVLDLTADSPSASILNASRQLENIAIEFPSLESQVLAIAEYLNAISHEKHALERLRLCELITETTGTETRVEYMAKLPELRFNAARSSEASKIARDKILMNSQDPYETQDPIR